ncbi:hypothetical protein D3C71_1153560 [compost metagenome]
MWDLQVVDFLADAFRRLTCLIDGDAGQQYHELFAAKAGNDIPGTYRIADRGGYPNQRLIAHHVAVVIVIGFEMVDIQQQNEMLPVL